MPLTQESLSSMDKAEWKGLREEAQNQGPSHCRPYLLRQLWKRHKTVRVLSNSLINRFEQRFCATVETSAGQGDEELLSPLETLLFLRVLGTALPLVPKRSKRRGSCSPFPPTTSYSLPNLFVWLHGSARLCLKPEIKPCETPLLARRKILSIPMSLSDLYLTYV